MSKYMTTPPLPVAPQQIVSSTWDISRVDALIHLPAKLSDEAKKAKKKAHDLKGLQRRYSSQSAETHQARREFDIASLKVTKPGWCGVRLGKGLDALDLMGKWESGAIMDVLKHFHHIPFKNPHL